MQKHLLLLCLFLALSCRSYGLSGGPFDGGAADGGGGEGTYQGVFSGNNLIGIIAFGWSNSGPSTGRWAFFHKGFVRFGNMEAVVNLPGRRVAGIFEGVLEATGAFNASITRTAPTILFEGQGRVASPANANTTTSVTSTVEVSTSTSTEADGTNINTNTTVITTEDTVQSSVETDPFRIQGVRTSVQVGNFAPIAAGP